MEFENYVKENINLFGEDDDDILFNPIYYINKFENSNKNTNKNITIVPKSNQIDIPPKKNHISNNSTLNTNAALDESSQNINYNISFFSFNGNQQKEQKKEMTQKSIEILNECILKEKKMIENNSINNNIIEKDNKKIIKKIKIKDLKNNSEKLEQCLNIYFKNPFMRKNYEKAQIFKKIEIKDNNEEEDQKIDFFDEINEKKKLYNKNKFNVNNNNNINEI